MRNGTTVGGRWSWMWMVLGLVGLLAGCGSKLPSDLHAALDAPESFVLYSLDGDEAAAMRAPAGTGFHQYGILGTLPITDAAARAKLVAALDRGLNAVDKAAAHCFNPRHGIRVVREGHTYDLLICFECVQVQAFKDGEFVVHLPTDGSPLAEFNAPLIAAGVPLAKPADGK